MSDLKKEDQQKLEQMAKIEKIRQETYNKRVILDSKTIDVKLKNVMSNEKELEIAKHINFGSFTEEDILELQHENQEYMRSAKIAMGFVNSTFKKVVPYFRKNIILIGAKTGDGKSTTAANIIYSTISQKNPITGKPRRALVITNEERREDVYNRVTCLARGWHYTNHDEFTDEQIEFFDKSIEVLTRTQRLQVVDNTFKGTMGLTSSIEGIQTIFDNLIRDKVYYDVIIIDYYQNVNHSKKDPHLNQWEAQAKLANLLDRYKNIYPAPIVVLAQTNPPDKSNTPFQQRIRGRKSIVDVSTCVLEMVADRENLRTQWIVHKNRFVESIGQGFFTGYNKGRFVEYTKEFQINVAKYKEEKMARSVLKGVFKEGKDGKEGRDESDTDKS